MFACNGILFNHESPMRGETFVTRKITRAVAKIALDMQDVLYIGNLEAKRDWGHAKDYVEVMWKILQYHTAEDWVIATGVTTSVRDFIRMAFSEIGLEIIFNGKGADETGSIGFIDEDLYVHVTGQPCHLTAGNILVRVDKNYYRPTEVDLLVGDATKAKEKLDWIPKHDVSSLCKEMVLSDIGLFHRIALLKREGFDITNEYE